MVFSPLPMSRLRRSTADVSVLVDEAFVVTTQPSDQGRAGPSKWPGLRDRPALKFPGPLSEATIKPKYCGRACRKA